MLYSFGGYWSRHRYLSCKLLYGPSPHTTLCKADRRPYKEVKRVYTEETRKYLFATENDRLANMKVELIIYKYGSLRMGVC